MYCVLESTQPPSTTGTTAPKAKQEGDATTKEPHLWLLLNTDVKAHIL